MESGLERQRPWEGRRVTSCADLAYGFSGPKELSLGRGKSARFKPTA